MTQRESKPIRILRYIQKYGLGEILAPHLPSLEPTTDLLEPMSSERASREIGPPEYSRRV